jgi:hypothetical protein
MVSAIDDVLGSDREVVAIDAIEPGPEDPSCDAVHVLAEEAGIERIRRKVVTGFAFVDIEDVTDTDAAGRAPRLRIRAGAVRSLPPSLSLETRQGRASVARQPAGGGRF